MSGLHAVVFDFDGVVADSEPVHLECFQAVFKTVGIDLDADRYRQRYLGMDDRDAIAAISADASVQLASHRVAMLIDTKTKLVQRILRERAEALPGSVEIIRALRRGGTPLAVCSGALRPEILAAAERIGVPDAFDVIVSAEDVAKGKPSPEGYRLALRLLGEALGWELAPARCVAIEDSPFGISAAREAGMKVLALTTSHPAEDVADADRVVENLAAVGVDDVRGMVG